MTLQETIVALKSTYSQQIFANYGYNNTRKKYTALETADHNNRDKNPSMALYRKGESFYLKDFAGQQKMYSAIDLIMFKEGLSFMDAVKRGAEICNITIDNERQQEELSPDMKYIVSGLYRKAKQEGFSVKDITDKHHYLYKDADGKKLFDKYRIDYIDADGERHKYIVQGKETNGFVKLKFENGEYQNFIAMYGDFRQFKKGEKIYICEGEKCVDVSRSRGLKNVLTVGSSNDFKYKGKKFAPYFKDTDIVILQDNDSPGEKLTREIISALEGAANSIKVIVPDRSREKADIADFFQNGGTLQQLEEMEEKTEPIKKVAKESSQNLNLGQDSMLDYTPFHFFNDNGKITGVFDFAIFEHIKEHYNIFICSGNPYIYVNGVYIYDKEGTKIKKIIREYLYPQYRKSRTINQIYNLIIEADELQKDFSELNCFPKSYINFKDCVIDAETMQEILHNPCFFALNQLPYKWEEVKKATEGKEIEKFFNFIFSDPEDREMFLEYAGYCLTTDTRQQMFLTLCGQGGTGKSVLIRLLEAAVGEKNTTNVAMQDLSKRFSTSLLVGKTLNSCADLSAEALEDTSTMKKLIGEDKIMAENKGQTAFMFKNYSKLLFSTNSLPVITEERTNGFYRRMLILKMDRRPDKPDVKLTDRLLLELPYFIKLSIQSVHEMYNRGIITVSENSKAAVLQMRKDSDVVEAWISERCTIGTGLRAERTAAFKNFEEYCKNEERKALTRNGFFKALRAKSFSEIRSSSERFFSGISVGKVTQNSKKSDGFMTVTNEQLAGLPFFIK